MAGISWIKLLNRVSDLFVDRRPHIGLGKPAKTISTTFLSLCEEQIHVPVHLNRSDEQLELQPPKPVIFHDGRFAKRLTPGTALLILLFIPFGIVLAAVRMFLIFVLPFRAMSYVNRILGIRVTVRGKPPQAPATARNSGLLFVGNHRTPIDGVVLSHALGRSIPSIIYNVVWFPGILSPIPVVWITRKSRYIDAEIIKQALSKGDLSIYPEGITCHESFLLRFSALFAELTDGIVPIAMDYDAGFFRATTRGWGGLNLVFFFMNPTLVYDVTFLDQLPLENTCSSGKNPYDVANHVQRILADTLGFECTNFTRKDKYKFLT